MTPSTAIVWYRRDLRRHDHPPLTAALAAHDPDGAYVRRWVAELAAVPTARIHAPWEMSPAEQRSVGCVIGVDYPEPIVDHTAARARALARYADARRTS
jgi:deoxyribodipyrimidine photo-lyase